MAGLPKVTIIEENGALGLVAGSSDGVAAFALAGVAVAAKIALLEPKQIFSTADAKALGLDEAYDTANSTNVWKTLKDFYAQAGEGAECWIMLYVNTTTMTTVADKANNIINLLLDAADGNIDILGIGRVPDGAYAPVYTDGIDPDVVTAIAKAQELAEEYAGQMKPVRVVIDARDFQGVVGDLIDLTQSTDNRVLAAISTDVAGSLSAAIGLVVGRLAANPVQRNIGRVKDGDLGVAAAYLTDGATKIEDLTAGAQDIVHNKSFCFMRRWQGKNGYFFNDDPTATAKTDDYSSIARGRVIDKARRIAYATYINEILDDLEVDDNGYIQAAVIKDYQAKIQNALDLEMTTNEEVSSVRCTIDPKQNVLSTNKVAIGLKIRPKFYSKEIEVTLGFENPALA